MSEAARRSLEELQASILFASDFPKRITYTPAIPSGASARGRLDDQRARVASKCFEALFSNFIAFIADWQDIRAEPQLLVPRGGIRQFNGINGLGCPTVTNLPIESTCLFSRLSHPFWSRRATSRSFSVSSILNSRAAASIAAPSSGA